MAPHKLVLLPDQADDHDVEQRKRDQTDAMRIGETVHLVDDEKPQDDEGKRIGPDLAPKQAGDE